MSNRMLVVLAVVSCLGASGCTKAQAPQPPSAFVAAQVLGEQITLPLTEAIATLRVVPEKRDGYLRTKFRHWTDADRDGCDTRAEVLIDEATPPVRMADKCRVLSGGWHSWYDAQAISDAKLLDIDHVVPLAEAWDSGAREWNAARREAYANDLGEPQSLVAVSIAVNASKGDADPTEWLPPAKDALCRYVTSWTAVKVRWHLTVDEAERTKLAWVAQGCLDSVVAVVDVPDIVG